MNPVFRAKKIGRLDAKRALSGDRTRLKVQDLEGLLQVKDRTNQAALSNTITPAAVLEIGMW